jgi:hypothetical protein
VNRRKFPLRKRVAKATQELRPHPRKQLNRRRSEVVSVELVHKGPARRGAEDEAVLDEAV